MRHLCLYGCAYRTETKTKKVKVAHYVCREYTNRMGVWSCKRDEGRSLGAGDQAQASNHCELLALRALVVSVAGKGGDKTCQVRSGETSASEPLMTCRNL